MTLVRTRRGCGCDKSISSPIIKGDKGDQGIQGYNGWSPKTANVEANRPAGPDAFGTATTEVVSGGNIVIQKFICWIGGSGPVPSQPIAPNIYVGASSFTSIVNAVNIKGPQGPSGSSGLADSGWQPLKLKTGYPASHTAQYRVVGNEISFSGSITIAFSARAPIAPNTAYSAGDAVGQSGSNYRNILPFTTGATPTQPSADSTDWTLLGSEGASATPDPGYITLGGSGNRETLAFQTDSGGNIPLGTTVGGVVLPGSLPNIITIVNQRLTRSVGTSGGLRVGMTATVNNIIFDTSGNLLIGTLADADIISGDATALGADMRRQISANILKRGFVPDWRTFKHSLTTSGSNTLTLASINSTDVFLDTIDASDANYLGGFTVVLDGTKGFIN